MESRKRELDCVIDQECRLRAQLDSVVAKRLRLHQEYYGPFSFFSLLPLKILFVILEHVVKAHIRDGLPLSQSYSLLLTCRGAHQLSNVWATHLYRRMGGIRADLAPPLGQLCRELDWLLSKPSYNGDRDFASLFILGMDTDVLNSFTKIVHWKMDFGFVNHTLNPKFVCAEFTRALFRYRTSYLGGGVMKFAVKNKLVQTIPWDEWLAYAREVDLRTFADSRLIWDEAESTMLALVDSAPSWKIAFAAVMGHLELKAWFPRLRTLFQVVKEGWFTSWYSVHSHLRLREWELILEDILAHAPDFMIALPGVDGGPIEGSPLFAEPVNCAMTIFYDAQRHQRGESRLLGVIRLNKTFEVHVDNLVPEHALLVEQHMERLGGRIRWVQ